MATALYLWQRAAVALAEYACGYDSGRGKLDRVYIEVTEGRDGPGPVQWRSYSSCADLAHWLYMRLGVRAAWLNRTDDDFAGPWAARLNVSRLAWPPSPAIAPRADWAPEPGDVVIAWNAPDGRDAHVMVALEYLPLNGVPGGRLRTANYGAGGMSASEHPGARLGGAPLRREGAAWMYGGKRVQRVIRLRDVITLITVCPNLSGAALTGEELDALDGGKGYTTS